MSRVPDLPTGRQPAPCAQANVRSHLSRVVLLPALDVKTWVAMGSWELRPEWRAESRVAGRFERAHDCSGDSNSDRAIGFVDCRGTRVSPSPSQCSEYCRWTEGAVLCLRQGKDSTCDP
jgi:hypothetical protein